MTELKDNDLDKVTGGGLPEIINIGNPKEDDCLNCTKDSNSCLLAQSKMVVCKKASSTTQYYKSDITVAAYKPYLK